jgi:hypothetical protein
MDEGDLRHELEVTLHARQEVGPALEPELVCIAIVLVNASYYLSTR